MKSTIKSYTLVILGIVLSIFTVYLITRTNMTQDNLTYVANVLDYHFLYILWSFLSGCFFFISIRDLYKRIQLTHPFYLVSQSIVLLMLVSSSLIPYDMNVSPILSSMHVDSISLAVILYFVFLGFYLFHLSRTNFIFAKKSSFYFIILLTLSMMIFVHFGKITGLMELVLMMGMIWFTLYLLYFDK